MATAQTLGGDTPLQAKPGADIRRIGLVVVGPDRTGGVPDHPLGCHWQTGGSAMSRAAATCMLLAALAALPSPPPFDAPT
jgi:hypothetical protein